MAEYDVFLSYNKGDQGAVEMLARRLREVAKLHPFLDEWHLIPGRPWQEGIEEALERSQTVAVFVGPSGISTWHNEEMRTALDLAVRTRDEYRVIPVLLPDADPKCITGFLARRVWVDFRPGLDDEDAFARLVAGILGQPQEQAGPFALPDEPAPYPGLLPFTAQEAEFFFGRADERDKLLERVQASPFVAVVGASGSGKSSLVLAGLLPALDKDWHALVLVPGVRPLRALADHLATLATAEDQVSQADDFEARLTTRRDGLSTAISTLLANRPNIVTLLIIVDQFEELFTQKVGTPGDMLRQQSQFIANLVDTVRTSGGRARVVLTLRADFVRHCLEFADLRALLEPNQFLLGPMGEDALREAIVRPAQMVGAMLEKRLVGRLLDDTRGQPSALPLLGFTLAQLWQRRHGVWLTHAAYEAVGRVGGALDKRADAVYIPLTDRQKHLARNLFVRLVALGEGTSNTRRRVGRSELDLAGATPGEVEELIGILSRPDVRLIATDMDTVELAHEALIEQWGRLRDWLEEDHEALRTHRRLTEAARDWGGSGRHKSYLYRGIPRAPAREWANAHAEDLSRQERQFLKASRRAMRIGRIAAAAAVVVATAVLAALMTLGVTGQLNRWFFRPLPMEWVAIPASEFVMGSSREEIERARDICRDCSFSNEQPQHTVYLDAYEINRYEVTNKQYRQCNRAGVCDKPNNKQHDDHRFNEHPVTGVNWEDARMFCDWAGGRLPYEAEWEKAARGDTGDPKETRMFPWGDDPNPDNANVDQDNAVQTMAVGSYSPRGDSPYDVSDMAGNVWEWVMDWYDEKYYDNSPTRNPKGPGPGTHRVMRGGSFENGWAEARSAYRAFYRPSNVWKDIGFRCARQPPQ